MLHFTIIRKQLSLQYRKDPSLAGDWANQRVNNSLDDLFLYNDDALLFQCKVQSVSNMESLDPGVNYLDTIASGDFFLKAFRALEYPTSHYGRIHGVVGAVTMNGEKINDDSITSSNASPWLCHDWQRIKPNPSGVDTSVAWSAGCLVVPDSALAAIGSVFDTYGVKVGDKIAVHLEMES